MVLNLNQLKTSVLCAIFIFDSIVWGLGFEIFIYVRVFLYISALLLLLFDTRNFPFTFSFRLVILFIIYVLILSVFNTSNIFVSLDSGMKIGFSLLLYLYSFVYINDFRKFQIFSKYSFISLIIIFFSILLSNFFKFGDLSYHDETTTLRFGEAGVNISKNITVLSILSIPYLISRDYSEVKKLKKILLYLVIFVSVILVILSTKRSTMLLLAFSFVVYLILNKRYFLRSVVPITIMVLLTFFFFQNIIVQRIENRARRFEVTNSEAVEEEWRVVETNIAISKFEAGHWTDKLFGNESFNEFDAYDLPYMFHNDFAVLLGSTGLVGVLLHVLLISCFFFWYKRVLYSSKFDNAGLFKWMYISLSVGLIIFGVSGNFKTLGGSLSSILAGLGSIRGVFLNRFR